MGRSRWKTFVCETIEPHRLPICTVRSVTNAKKQKKQTNLLHRINPLPPRRTFDKFKTHSEGANVVTLKVFRENHTDHSGKMKWNALTNTDNVHVKRRRNERTSRNAAGYCCSNNCVEEAACDFGACRTLARRPAAYTAYHDLSSTCSRWHLGCHHGCCCCCCLLVLLYARRAIRKTGRMSVRRWTGLTAPPTIMSIFAPTTSLLLARCRSQSLSHPCAIWINRKWDALFGAQSSKAPQYRALLQVTANIILKMM